MGRGKVSAQLASKGAYCRTLAKEKSNPVKVTTFGATHYKRLGMVAGYQRDQSDEPIPEGLHELVAVGVVARLICEVL